MHIFCVDIYIYIYIYIYIKNCCNLLTFEKLCKTFLVQIYYVVLCILVTIVIIIFTYNQYIMVSNTFFWVFMFSFYIVFDTCVGFIC